MATDWDAVLCDFSLPGWDGLDALKEIRATSPDLPFLFVSGTIGEGSRGHGNAVRRERLHP